MGIPNSTIQRAKPLIFSPGKFLKIQCTKKSEKIEKLLALNYATLSHFNLMCSKRLVLFSGGK